MKTLARSLASSLIPLREEEAGDPPTVYTTAICTDADLVTCLTGISRITRLRGFTVNPQTLYRDGCLSATYHVDHQHRAVALAVECHPERRTVSLAVTGHDPDETLEEFAALEQALFGGC